MPLYEYACADCGAGCELLIIGDSVPQCPDCGGTRLTKRFSATSTLTGRSRKPLPGAKDTGCCGAHPHQAGCAGPGSCCGKAG